MVYNKVVISIVIIIIHLQISLDFDAQLIPGIAGIQLLFLITKHFEVFIEILGRTFNSQSLQLQALSDLEERENEDIVAPLQKQSLKFFCALEVILPSYECRSPGVGMAEESLDKLEEGLFPVGGGNLFYFPFYLKLIFSDISSKSPLAKLKPWVVFCLTIQVFRQYLTKPLALKFQI